MSAKGWKRRMEGFWFVVFAPDEETGWSGLGRGQVVNGVCSSVLIVGGPYTDAPPGPQKSTSRVLSARGV